jgi:aspartyl-tRNA(Asn)/glutamyl-tRNA(Gln) amidotransferase subunit A
MTQIDLQQRDLEFRRQLLRQAAEQVRQIDLGEAWPVGGFQLDGSRPATGQTGQPVASRSASVADGPAGSPVAELGRRYRSGDLSPVEEIRQALEQAEATQPTLNAFITLLGASALEAARVSEARFRRGEPLGPLDGVPIAIKDLIHVAGERTTAGSRVMADFVATADAPIVQRLRAAGAIIIGKTNLHEFAYGGTGDVSFTGPAHNPRNPEHMTGGSSSGSAAAVGGGICPVALGTDTACSIRTPAALCGIVGLKPTYGRVATEGVIPLSWSQDHVGPMTASVEDAGLVLAAISDFAMPDLTGAASQKLTIGVCHELFFERLDADVRRLVERAIGLLGQVRDVRIPHIRIAGAVQALITSPEARAFHHHWMETRSEDYDWSVRNRLEAGREVTGLDYVQATRLRGLLAEEMRAALAGVDVLAMPTVAVTAPKFGQREAQLEDGVAEAVGPLMLRNAAPMNVTGFPAITIPCGNAANGLPVGLQLVGLPWEEGRLLQAAHAFETRFLG